MKLESFKNGVFVMSFYKLILIIKLDDVKGMVSMKYQPNFDFEFDSCNKSVISIDYNSSFHFNLFSKHRKNGLMDYFDVLPFT